MYLFVISISGTARISARTLNLIQEVENTGGIVYWIGEELDHSGLLNNIDLSLAKFVVGGDISEGEFDCLMNHQKIYQKIIDMNISSALIIEDDADLVVSTQKLFSTISNCESSNYEIVNLHSTLGGVFVGANDQIILKALIPPLSAFSYWITNYGAHLMRNKIVPAGLADWPLNIHMFRSAATRENLFMHGDTQSLIKPTLNESAKERIHIAYRPLRQIFNLKNITLISRVIDTTGKVIFFRIVIYQRFLKKVSRKLKRKKDNSSIKFII
jgi:hypothetical protein